MLRAVREQRSRLTVRGPSLSLVSPLQAKAGQSIGTIDTDSAIKGRQAPVDVLLAAGLDQNRSHVAEIIWQINPVPLAVNWLGALYCSSS